MKFTILLITAISLASCSKQNDVETIEEVKKCSGNECTTNTTTESKTETQKVRGIPAPRDLIAPNRPFEPIPADSGEPAFVSTNTRPINFKKPINSPKPITPLTPVITPKPPVVVFKPSGVLYPTELMKDTMIYENIAEPGETPKLKRIKKFSKGSKIYANPQEFISSAMIEKSDGTFKQKRGRYYGPIKLSKWRRKLNKKSLYVYGYKVNKPKMLKPVYDLDLPLDAEKIRTNYPWDKVSSKGLWTYLAYTALGDLGMSMLDNPPEDVESFCPGYREKSDDNKKKFWIGLMNAIAKRESGYDPTVGNDESLFSTNPNHKVISRGLLQVSYSSSRAKRYREAGCTPKEAKDLHNPETILRCGVAIFSALSTQYNCISCKFPEGHPKAGKWAGIARYWSTLREKYTVPCKICSSGVAKIGFKPEIQAYTKKQKYCQSTLTE